MKTISIRQFQRNFYKELLNVPFIVTRQDHKTKENVPSFIIAAYSEDNPLLEDEPVRSTYPDLPPTPTPTEMVYGGEITEVEINGEPVADEVKPKKRFGSLRSLISRQDRCPICPTLDPESEAYKEHRSFWHSDEK